jgi:Glycosyltransferase
MTLATNNRKSLIYIAPTRATFVMQDIEALEKEFDLTSYFFSGKKKIWVPWEFLKLFLFLLLRKKQAYLISFGGYHSFIASLVAKIKGCKSYIILNGTDAVSIEEFDYGHLRKGLLRYCCKKSYQFADLLLPVSQSLLDTTNTYAFEGKKLGLSTVFPDHHWPYKIIPNGFDCSFWKPDIVARINKSVVTVASLNRINHKGVDLLLQLAERNADYTFSIVGIDHIKGVPQNVVFHGYLQPDELRKIYSSSQYYFQLSIWEGFGCALCEAMLCGCIPIVSDVNILSEIVDHKDLV